MESGKNKCYLIEINGFNNLTFSMYSYYNELLEKTICFQINKCMINNCYDFMVSYNLDYYSIQNSSEEIEKYFINEELKNSYEILCYRLMEIIEYELFKFHMNKDKQRYILNVTSVLVNNYTLCICFNQLVNDYGKSAFS